MSEGCHPDAVLAGSAVLAVLGALELASGETSPYGRHLGDRARPGLSARAAWLLQELPSFALPAGALVLLPARMPNALLLALFCGHYFHRTFIYSMLTRGRPFPVSLLVRACLFCVGNGILQAHSLSYCADYPAEWHWDPRFLLGILLFVVGMAVNIHSDNILRQLRKPGEVIYRIPRGGLFTYVSGANFLGEIMEWMGFALATWTLPALAFAFFTVCFLGLRAVHHHRFYLRMFEDYPKSRKALIPFIF